MRVWTQDAIRKGIQFEGRAVLKKLSMSIFGTFWHFLALVSLDEQGNAWAEGQWRGEVGAGEVEKLRVRGWLFASEDRVMRR
jgi:hypothetical protein